jgi:uncharacterized YccA/Bax inhibitor family protein
MANPVLNDSAFRQAKAAGGTSWAAPTADSRFGTPISDGPITNTGRMTFDGTVTATGVMLALLLVAGGAGWVATNGRVSTPIWLVAVLGSFAIGMFLRFKPNLSPILAPIYSIVMGFALGAISHAYEYIRNGIVVQAIGATVAVFAVMLFLVKSKILKVTDKFRRIVMAATGGLMLFYLVSFVLSFFGFRPAFLNAGNGSALGIGFSLLAAGLAASNLAVDFDTVDRGVRSGAPKYMEWYCAFGITSTLVWLYLEILRLLSRLRD